MNRNRKKVLLVVLISIGIAQLFFVGLYPSRRVWVFRNFSLDTSGNLTININSSLFPFNRYYFEACGWSREDNDPQLGNVKFIHRRTGKAFFFNYVFYNPPGYEESFGVFWFLPSGIYNVTWENSDADPYYNLYSAGYLFPVDKWFPELVIFNSFILFIISVIIAIKNTVHFILGKKG